MCFSDTDENGNGPVGHDSSLSSDSSSSSETDSDEDSSDSDAAPKKKNDVKSKPKVASCFVLVQRSFSHRMITLLS